MALHMQRQVKLSYFELVEQGSLTDAVGLLEFADLSRLFQLSGTSVDVTNKTCEAFVTDVVRVPPTRRLRVSSVECIQTSLSDFTAFMITYHDMAKSLDQERFENIVADLDDIMVMSMAAEDKAPSRHPPTRIAEAVDNIQNEANGSDELKRAMFRSHLGKHIICVCESFVAANDGDIKAGQMFNSAVSVF